MTQPVLNSDERLALIHQETRLRLTLDYLNYNGVVYTQNLVPSKSVEKIDRSAA
ncbi:MAG: hypothetical protein ACW98I_14860 [Candidatus Hodarchaeales archaeon]|jgi:hypothetical protein